VNPIAIAYLIGALAAAGIGTGWYLEHNRKEQLQGFTVCQTKYTVLGEAQAVDTSKTDAEHARQLETVVGGYDEKIRALNAANAFLAQRMHELALKDPDRAGAVSHLGAPAEFVCTPRDTPGPTDRDRREAVDLEACAANTIELIAIREAWQKLATPSKEAR
jgi:hypothetical protein